MMEAKKQKLKRLRQEFNDKCMARDGGKCVTCGDPAVDVHHITNRHFMPNDGYAPENGISLCSVCHNKAEDVMKSNGFYASSVVLKFEYLDFTPAKLYERIGSSLEKAKEACEKLT